MLDINLIRNSPEKVKEALLKRMLDIDFSELLGWDEQRRTLSSKNDNLKAERNRVSAEIPKMKKENIDVQPIYEQMKTLKETIEKCDKEIDEIAAKIKNFLVVLPNLPDEDVLAGNKENNKVVTTYGSKPVFDFELKNHVDLCESNRIIDYKRGAKLSGSGFWIYTGVGAQLEWALLNFFISEHIKDKYEFVMVPHVLNYECGFGAGQFPKFADEVFWLQNENSEAKKFLLPTAETALVNIHSDEIVDEKELPKKYFAYTPCFRKEAGSYRSEERGMIRGHQFNKIEMVQYARPNESDAAFTEMLGKAESLVKKLNLHYIVSKLAAGDCSASMSRTYDIEVWIPSMNIYKEVSSVSNANDYQCRRNNTRFRNSESGKIEFLHTLNGSGLATSRIIPAIVEQYQNKDGSVTVPEVLRPFMGGLEIIK